MSELLELVKEHLAAEDRQDVEATVATFTKDCIYKIDAFGIDLRGRQQAREHYAATFAAFPDFRNTDVTWWDCETDVFLKARVIHTIVGEWNGVQPPPEKIGTEISFWAFAHFPRAADGLLLGENVYLNGNEILSLFGVLPSGNVFDVVAGYQR